MYKEITFSVREAAKFIKFPGGEKKFFTWLRENKYLQQNNEPYQKYIDKNWMKYVDKKIERTSIPLVVGVTKVTIEGLAGLKKVVRAKFPLCPPCEGLS